MFVFNASTHSANQTWRTPLVIAFPKNGIGLFPKEQMKLMRDEFAFPTTGDPDKDQKIADGFILRTDRIDRGICPNGCGPLIKTPDDVRECAICGFEGYTVKMYAGLLR